LIEEYENADVPEDLARRFDGYEVSVGVWFNEPSQIGCGYHLIVRRPKPGRHSHIEQNSA
jgi:hypothetical protein